MKSRLLGVLALLYALPLAAQEPQITLEFPLACTLGDTCVIQQFVDHRFGTQVADYACGAASYDGHKGTDFRITDRTAFAAGVPVLAMADGRVVRMRDGVVDARKRDATELANTKGEECGNGLFIQHAHGWSTQYCHLRAGSVAVKQGRAVRAGDVLGMVGLSGRTQFPHLHVTLRRKNEVIDPFTAKPRSESCEIEPGRTLWSDASGLAAFAYQPTQIIDLGFYNAPIDLRALEEGAYDGFEGAPDDPARVAYMRAINLRKGDVVEVQLTGPDRVLVQKSYPALERRRAIQMWFFGRKNTTGQWPAGDYRTIVRIMRGDKVIAVKEAVMRHRDMP